MNQMVQLASQEKLDIQENVEFQGTPDLLVMPEHLVNMEQPALMAMLETGVRKGSLEPQDAEVRLG